MPKKLVVICLINFLIAALLGLILRYSFIGSIDVNYRFLSHAHSHIAMLGWVYLMLYTLIVHYFVPDKKPIYNRLFWITEFSVIGMLLSFPFQGYAAISITFSTLHIFCSYYFVYLIWKHQQISNLPTRYLLKASLIFMLLSIVGIWCLGPVIVVLGKSSAFYEIAIQFFLHFQFNGWFLIAVMALFFHIIQLKDSKTFSTFFTLLIVSTILTLALPINWYAPNNFFYLANALGVVMQLFTLILFLKLIIPYRNILSGHYTKLSLFMLGFSIFCFVLKSTLQLVSLIPEVSQTVYEHRNFVIGFIHLTMLGIITGFLFFFILQNRLVFNNYVLRLGIYTFVLGFLVTEIILIIQGSLFYLKSGFMPNYYLLLFVFSLLILLGIMLIIINILSHKNTEVF